MIWNDPGVKLPLNARLVLGAIVDPHNRIREKDDRINNKLMQQSFRLESFSAQARALAPGAGEKAPEPPVADLDIQPQLEAKSKLKLPPGTVIPQLIPDGPDLVVSDLEVEAVLPGQNAIDGSVSNQLRWHFVWTVRNQGNEIAPATQLKATCEQPPFGQCVGGISATYNIPQLWPNPNEISGAHKVWNNTPLVVPPGLNYMLRAEADWGNKVAEQNEQNNKYSKMYQTQSEPSVDPQAMDASKMTPKSTGFAPPGGGLGTRVQRAVPVQPTLVPKHSGPTPAVKAGRLALASPRITYPRNNQTFSAPARFTAKATYPEGRKVVYRLKRLNNWTLIQQSSSGRFANIPVGGYCVEAAYANLVPKLAGCAGVRIRVLARKAMQAPAVPRSRATTQPSSPGGQPGGGFPYGQPMQMR
jgi:hypothetical protein